MKGYQRAKIGIVISGRLAGHAVGHLVGEIIGSGRVQVRQHVHQLARGRWVIALMGVSEDANRTYRDLGGMVS